MTLETQPDVAATVFGPGLAGAQLYADLLVGDGITRGLLGPREAERIWTRHLLNCAVLGELFEPSARIVDVGSGAGLPGLVLAICRPDLRVDLLEPLQRRAQFLTEAVARLGLGARVRVVRGRAEERSVRAELGNAAWVTARAVAPLDRLLTWCAPLLAPGGRLAAVKGRSAADEIAEHRATAQRLGMDDPHVMQCGNGVVDPPVTVVIATLRATAGSSRARRKEQR